MSNDRELTPKQMRFVEHYINNGCNGTQAAISAGYSAKTARQQASDTLALPYIKAEIEKRLDEDRADLQRAMRREARKAMKALADILADPHAPQSARVSAANSLLDRSGYKPSDQLEVTGGGGEPLKVIFNIPRPEPERLDDTEG
jgi:phage terminase small subunit